MTKFSSLVILLATICLFASCDKDSNNEPLLKPKLVFSTDTIVLQENEAKNLSVSVDGIAKVDNEIEYIDYEIIEYPDWVDIYPLSGKLSSSIQSIHIQPKSELNTPGVYTGDLIFFTSLGKDVVHLKRFVGECLLYELPDSINISMFDSKGIFSIKNLGNIDVAYQVKASNDLISFSSNKGIVNINSEASITMNIDRSKLESGTYDYQVFVDLNDVKDTINIRLENLKEHKIILKDDIVDAEFCKRTNKIIYVSSDPLSLVIYDVVSKTSESMALTYIPTCISISDDGNYAVVGHDGRISYINLATKDIIKTIDVPCIAFDIVLNKKWAYVSPKRDQWTYLQCVNLDNGTSNPHVGGSINAGAKIKLHPSGKYIHLVDNGIYPGDIHKFDIQAGVANYLYDSPYHGDYSISGDLNFSEDGKRIFIATGTVLKSSEVQSQDLLYNGTIKDVYIKSLAHSPQKNNLYITGDSYYNSSDYVYVYNAENLVRKEQIELEKYIGYKNNSSSGSLYKSVPKFIFTNTTGNNVYVLANCPESGLLYNWSLQELTIK